ncbi:hypothetical protein [Sinorhizobium meliloti]|uniref:hypothetical protein n=1 Tax=Rhizobium meliloti TaxID=382 RepID=UPI001F464D1D|nr:hypothetical protein [Sinorhizobium meliloti]
MAPETAVTIPDLLTGLDAKPTQQLRRHAIVVALATVFGSVRVCPRSVADTLQLNNSALEVGIVHFGETILDRLI